MGLTHKPIDLYGGTHDLVHINELYFNEIA